MTLPPSGARWRYPGSDNGDEVVKVCKVRQPFEHDAIVNIDVVVHEHVPELHRATQAVREVNGQHSVGAQQPSEY